MDKLNGALTDYGMETMVNDCNTAFEINKNKTYFVLDNANGSPAPEYYLHLQSICQNIGSVENPKYRISQMAQNAYYNSLFFRAGHSEGTVVTWEDWQQIATKSDLGSYNTNWIWYTEWIGTRDAIENSAKGAGNYATFSGQTTAGIEGYWKGYKHNEYGEGIIYTRYYIIGFSFSGNTFKYKIIMELNL